MTLGNMHKNMVMMRRVAPETYGQTDKHAHHNTMLTYRGRVMIQQMHHNNTVGHAHDKHHVNQSNNVLFL